MSKLRNAQECALSSDKNSPLAELMPQNPEQVRPVGPPSRTISGIRLLRVPTALRALRVAALASAVLASAVVLWHFHDRFWYPSDEGIFANQAERIASGQTLNVDVQDVHAGYGTFVNAAALRLFGPELVSLRYPLVAAAFLQSCLAFALLRRRCVLLAATGAVATTALGVVQFLNPTPNWYCLALAFALALWMVAFPHNGARRLIGAGFLVGVIALFRQPSGVWAGAAVVVIALLDAPQTSERPGRLARLVLALGLLLSLTLLVITGETEPGGLVMFALWPAAILVAAMRRVRMTNRETGVALLYLATGAAIAASPLVVYLLAHGSAAAWFRDTVTGAFHVSGIAGDLGGTPWFAALTAAAADQTIRSLESLQIANGVYWMALPLLATLNGALTLRALWRGDDSSALALPVLAAFYSLVVLHMQDAIYLYFTVGLTLTAVLWMIGRSRLAVRSLWASLTLLLTVVALGCHAAQPYTRTPIELLQGRRADIAVSDCMLPRCGLRLSQAEVEPYRQLVALIQEEVPAGSPIAAFPSDAELYFLANRRNPFRFYNSAMGVLDAEDLEEVTAIIRREAPRIITFRPQDKYSTETTQTIMARVRTEYEYVSTIGGVEVYRITGNR